MSVFRWATKALLLGGVVAATTLPADPAAADVGLIQSLTAPQAVEVGQTGVNGSVTVFNNNTVPNQAEGNVVTQLRLAPSCGGTGSVSNPCQFPDPGVFSISTAIGAAGTACAGIPFTPSAPDAQGSVVLVPSAPVVLAPPGGTAGSDRCTVNFTFRVLRAPSIDSNPGVPGIQIRFGFRGEVTGQVSGLVVAVFSSAQVTVNRGSLQISTQASPSVVVGGTIFDTAALTVPAGAAAPTGTVTFQVFGPNDPTCASIVFQSTNLVSAGLATSNPYPVTQPGTYRFVAIYGGDANYLPATSPCNAPNELVVVRRKAVADFDGNGTTDVSVFRPSTGAWYLRTATPAFVQWGQAGDIPAPGDYDGNGTTDVAVFRPSTGDWYLRTPTPALIRWGANGDIPVPGDYDGNGTTDLAVFRPSTGAWYLRTATPAFVQWGQAGDIPAPGDYDGNGTTDVAVFRSTTGAWYLRTATPALIQWGTSGDVPVPRDYDGNGTTDVAVFRPSNGAWYLRTATPAFVQWGQNGDVPVPGDYDGNGINEVAVFRPGSGEWYLRTPTPALIQWGAAGDVPGPKPPVT